VAAAWTVVPLSHLVLLQLVMVMLPLQFGIGVSNDLFDINGDRLARRAKPLVTGAVTVRASQIGALALLFVGLGSAMTLSAATAVLAAIGLGAGLVYNIWLKGSHWAWLCWWVGFAALPICARVAVHAVQPAIVTAIPLAAGLALSTHLANALPDIEGDRLAGRNTLAARVGVAATRQLMLVVGLSVAALMLVLVAMSQLRERPALIGAALYVVAVATATILRVQRPFPLVALAAATLALFWLASLQPN